MRRLTLAVTLLLAPLALPAVAAAQEQQQQILQPEPLAADAPTAKVALALVELLLAGDRAKAEAYLKEHGTASFTESAEFAQAITGAIEALKSGPRVVVGQDGFSGGSLTGVGVRLAETATGEATRALVVRMEPAAPHRIMSLRVATIQMG